MADKTIKFSTVLDTANFDRQIREIQQKLQNITKMSDVSIGAERMKQSMGSVGMRSPEVTAKAKQMMDQASKKSAEELTKIVEKESLAHARILNSLTERKKRIEELKALQDSLEKSDQKRLELAEKIAKNEEKSSKIIDEARKKQNIVEQATASMRARGISGDGGFGGGGPSAPSMGSQLAQFLMSPATLGAIVGAAGKAVQFGGQQLLMESQMPIKLLERRAEVSGFASKSAKEVLGGRGMETFFFGKEFQKAMELSQKEIGARRTKDVADIAGSILKNVGVGAAAGAVGGSILPGLGTAVGGGLGALGGLGKGVMGVFGNERQRTRLLGTSQQVESMYAQEQLDTAESMITAGRKVDPMKRLAMDFLQSNKDEFLRSQRSLGFSDQSFFGTGTKARVPYKSKLTEADYARMSPAEAANARKEERDKELTGVEQNVTTREGFLQRVSGRTGRTTQEVMGMSAALLGAGGSTALGRSPEEALIQERRGLTNAAGVFGAISGRLGATGQTDTAVVKMLAEGMKLGINTSDLPQETRKFAESTAQLAVQSGTYTQKGFDTLTENFADFLRMTDRSMAGIEAAKGARDILGGIQQTGEGAIGALKYAALQQKPELQGLNLQQKYEFTNMSRSTLEQGGPVAESLLSSINKRRESTGQTKMTLDDLLKIYDEINAGMVFLTSDLEKRAKEFGSSVKTKMGKGKNVEDVLRENPDLKSELGSIMIEARSFNKNLRGKNELESQTAILTAISQMTGIKGLGIEEAPGSTDRIKQDYNERLLREGGDTSKLTPKELEEAKARVKQTATGEDTGRMLDVSVAGQAAAERKVLGEISSNMKAFADSARAAAEQTELVFGAMNTLVQGLAGDAGATKAVQQFTTEMEKATSAVKDNNTSAESRPSFFGIGGVPHKQASHGKPGRGEF
jgi:hypothetical protein